MSATTLFFLSAALLSAATVALLFSPFWRNRPANDDARDRRQTNLDVFRDQLRELESDRKDGLLATEDFEQAKHELQRRLLEETNTASIPVAESKGPVRRSAVVLAALIPLMAAIAYLQLGNPQALEPAQVRAHQQTEELDAMLVKLQQRLKANPEDAKGWVMLARSYKALGRFDEAIAAYARAHPVIEGDAYLLADYAETLVQANGGAFTEKADQLVARALKLDPDSMLALFLAGNSANDRNDFGAAIDFWERLLPQLEAGSEDAEAVEAAIEKARAALGDRGKSRKKQAAGKGPLAALEGEVVLSGKLASKAQPEDTVYIFARLAEGSRMPLAVVRARVADLPMPFRLDDANSLPGGQKLSASPSVVVEARIARQGIAQTTPGDLFGTLKGVKPGSKKLRLIIDQIQP